MASNSRSTDGRHTFTLSELLLWTTGIGVAIGLLINFGPGILVFPAIGFIAYAAADAHADRLILPFIQLIGSIAVLFCPLPPIGVVSRIEQIVFYAAIFTLGGWMAYRSIVGGSWPTRVLGSISFLTYLYIFLMIAVL